MPVKIPQIRFKTGYISFRCIISFEHIFA